MEQAIEIEAPTTELLAGLLYFAKSSEIKLNDFYSFLDAQSKKNPQLFGNCSLECHGIFICSAGFDKSYSQLANLRAISIQDNTISTSRDSLRNIIEDAMRERILCKADLNTVKPIARELREKFSLDLTLATSSSHS